MFTRAKIYQGSTYLEHHLQANDYYSQGERVSGTWVGTGAQKLGLSGDITPEHFEALRTNHHPITRDKLTPRTKETRLASTWEAELDYRKHVKKEGTPADMEAHRLKMGPLPNRVAFYDFQCSAQKSVSIMAVLSGDDRLRAAHEKASVLAFQELEKFAGRQANATRGRVHETTGNLCAAAFIHDASRALDPQLHTHFVVANATQDANGKWFALHENGMLAAIRYAGKVYQNELAKEVKALGYDIEAVREKGSITGFEISGVSPDLCQRFAKRREEIEKKIEAFQKEQGREPTRAEIHTLTKQTRPAKLKEITTSEVRKWQFGQLDPREWNQLQNLQVRARERAGVIRSMGQEKAALKAAVNHLFERQSVLPQHEILAEALNQNLGSLDLAKLTVQVNRDKGLVRLEDKSLCSLYATREGLKSELWSVALINRGKDDFAPLHPSFEPHGTLNLEQRAAIKNVLTTSDQCCAIRGVAGSGKTTLQRELQRGLEEAGHRVVAIAPTASAAKTLRLEGFSTATTVADFLQNHQAVPKAVVLCDEAGLQSNRQGEALLRLAQQKQMRLIFVGDVRQHVSVEAGDFLRVLETHSRLSHWEVTEIQRQKQEAYKGAVKLLASGAARDGLAALDKLSWVQEGQAHYLKEAAKAYFEATEGGRNLDRCLAVSPTWEENRHWTAEIRSGLKEGGLLPKAETSCSVFESLNWTVQQRANARNYQPGQVVTFNRAIGGWRAGESVEVVRVEKGKVILKAGEIEKVLPLKKAEVFSVGLLRSLGLSVGDKILIQANQKMSGLINGQVLTVAKIETDGTLQTREGVTVPASLKHWTHGYVVTSHKAQGRTCERVVVAAAKLDAKSAYVACSRGREACSVHTPDKAVLFSSLPSGHRPAALDVLAEQPDLSRISAYREIIAEIKRDHAIAQRRTAEAKRIITENKASEKVSSSMRQTPHETTQSENLHVNWEPVSTQKNGDAVVKKLLNQNVFDFFIKYKFLITF